MVASTLKCCAKAQRKPLAVQDGSDCPAEGRSMGIERVEDIAFADDVLYD